MSSPEPKEKKGEHMWRLIKSDIEYNRVAFLALYGIVVSACVLNAIWGGLEEHISRLMLVSVSILGIVVGSEEIKTKRIRLPVLLPISIRSNGILRFPVMFLYWISLMIILWVSSLISLQGNLGLPYLWFILVKTALIMATASSMNVSMDVPYCFIHRIPGDILKVFAKLFAVGAAFLYFFSTPYEDWPPVVTRYLSEIFISATGALALLIVGFGLAGLSVFVFEHRRSYAE
ncbi:MAG: hypothetical protein PVI66_07555 [Candidatus Aminicenantes bacterium]|jgi:hypothetical protein